MTRLNKYIADAGVCSRREADQLILDGKIKVKPFKIKSFVELISFVQDRPGHDYRYGIDASKLKNELNWEPTTSLDLGLLKTVDWYIKNQKFKSNLI